MRSTTAARQVRRGCWRSSRRWSAATSCRPFPAPRDLVLTVPDGHGGHAVAWEHALVPLEGSQTRLIVRARASSDWLDLARATPPSGHRRIFIERAYAVLARLPRPLLIGFAAFGHRVMEARHLRGIQRRAMASRQHGISSERWRRSDRKSVV